MAWPPTDAEMRDMAHRTAMLIASEVPSQMHPGYRGNFESALETIRRMVPAFGTNAHVGNVKARREA